MHHAFASLLAISLLLAACAPKLQGPAAGLVNRGILPLSTNDPYFGSNLFLSREMERSAYLYHFIRARGGPTAIELISSGSNPLHLVMFYPSKKEVFAAELIPEYPASDRSEPVWEWIIRGPYAIERQDYRDLVGMALSTQGEPAFVVHGEELRFGLSRPLGHDRVVTPALPPRSKPKPPPQRKAQAESHPAAAPVAEATVNIKDFKPLNSDQQALRMAKGFAERADNGDVLHAVSANDETIERIARWYTGSAENGTAIASLNHLTPNQPLARGTKIRIPLGSLKKLEAMPASFR